MQTDLGAFMAKRLRQGHMLKDRYWPGSTRTVFCSKGPLKNHRLVQ